MQPSVYDLHIDVPLTNYSNLVQGQQDAFIALKVAPPFPVDKLSNLYWKYDLRTMFRGDDNKEGNDGFLKEIGWQVSTGTYKCIKHGNARFISDREEANADTGVKPSRASQLILMRRNLIALETAVLTRLTDVSVLTQNTTLLTPFTDPASDPDSIFKSAREATIIPPNCAFTNEVVANALKNHPQMKDKYKYTSGMGLIPDELLAQAMGVQKLYVSRAKSDSSNLAASSGSFGYIMSNDIVFAYIEDTPALETPTLAWTFWFKGTGAGVPAAASTNPFYVRAIRDERRAGGGTYYECYAEYDEANIVTDKLAYLIKTAA